MKRILFIYNPHSGKELLKASLSDVIDVFVKAGAEVTVYPTQGFRDGYKKVCEFDSSKYDLLVCSGGDGTLDETVSGMMKRAVEDRLPIGYIPTGTTNDFANSLHIPIDLLAAADNVVTGTLFKCDVGAFNEGTFVYIAAFGLFTDVSYETKQEMKNALGHLAYVLEGTKRLFNIPSYHMKFTYGDEVIEDSFVYGMITNSRSVGGFRKMVSRDVDFSDGEFEVTLIKSPSNPIELQGIIASLMIDELDTDYIYKFKTDKLIVESEQEIPWTLDGEFGGNHMRVEIINRKQELGIMVPNEFVEE